MTLEIKNGTYIIPEGFTAKIDGRKIIVEKNESEDERIRKELIAVLEDLILPDDQRRRFLACLEKQKEQKPAEWSEEDEKRLNHILSLIKIDKEQEQKFIAFCGLNDLQERDKDVSWLKSLRPQPHWKPSEEQMDALLWCAAHLGGADHRVLAELYEHLKMYCL